MRRVAELRLTIVGIVSAVIIGLVLLAPRAVARTGETVPDGKSLIAIGENLVIDQPVSGDVRVIGGSVRISAPVAGRVTTFASDVVLTPEARIGGDLVVLGGSVRGEARPAVAGEVLIRTPERNESLAVGEQSPVGGLVQQPFTVLTTAMHLALLLFWLLAAGAIVLLFGRPVRSSSFELRGSLAWTFILGLVGFTSFVITAIVLSYLIPYGVGIPLLVILGGVAVATKVWGMVVVFHTIGTLVAGAKNRTDLQGRKWLRGDLAMTVVGLLILGLIRLIPVVGTFAWMAASVFGIGIALGTRFGRREPWFVAARPLPARS
jgi:hypothetical protein